MSEINAVLLTKEEASKILNDDSVSFDFDVESVPKTVNIKPDCLHPTSMFSLSAELSYDSDEDMPNSVQIDLSDAALNRKTLSPMDHMQKLAWIAYLMSDGYEKMYQMIGIKSMRANLSIPHGDLRDIRYKHSGGSCVIVSAGPSLEKEIHKFKNLPNNVIVIAVDRCVKLLTDVGVKVHYAVAIDPVKETKLEDRYTSEVNLICDVTTNKDVVMAWKGPKYYYLPKYDNKLMISMAIVSKLKAVIISGGNVATSAFSIARYLGFRNVAFIGHDYGVKVEQCSQCGHESTGKTHSGDDANEFPKLAGQILEIKGIDGKYKIPRTLLYQKVWTEATSDRFTDQNFINWSEYGCLGVDHVTGEPYKSIMRAPFGIFA